jgi:hypothetical protein
MALIGSVIEMEFNELWFSPLGQFMKRYASSIDYGGNTFFNFTLQFL